MAADPVRPARLDRGADRLRQDAGSVPRGHRCARAPGRAQSIARRDAHRLCLAAQGAVQRHPQEPGRAARRHPPGADRPGLSGCADPHPGAHRRHAASGAREDAAQAAAHPGDHPRVAVHPAHQRVGTQDARLDANRDRGRNPCARPQQAWCPPRHLAGAAGGVDRATPDAGRPVGYAETDRGGSAFPGRQRRAARARTAGRPGRAGRSVRSRSRLGTDRRPAIRSRPPATRQRSRSSPAAQFWTLATPAGATWPSKCPSPRSKR